MSVNPAVRICVNHEPYDVYCGRAGHGEDGYFGNPFRVGPDGSRNEVIAKHRSYFHARLRWDPAFLQRVLALRGKRLGCFCVPQLSCHVDNIVEYLNGVG